MFIQPRGFKRKYTGAALLLPIRRELDKIAAMYNCSRSFVQATILAKALGIKEQADYEIISRIKRRTTKARSSSKVVGIKSRKRTAA